MCNAGRTETTPARTALGSLCAKPGCGGQEPGKLLAAGPIYRGLRKKTKLLAPGGGGPRGQSRESFQSLMMLAIGSQLDFTK